MTFGSLLAMTQGRPRNDRRKRSTGPRPLPQQIPLPSFQHQHAILIVHRAAQPDHAGGPVGRHFVHFKRGIQRVADAHRRQEAAGLLDEAHQRVQVEAEVVHAGRLRDFFGFNRAKHAVIEAAILATRAELLPLEQIESEYGKLEVLVNKTGGDQERQAFAFLQDYIAGVRRRRLGSTGAGGGLS